MTDNNQQELRCRDLPTRPQPEMGRILVTGASGYIGGRLVPELLARGYRVRIMIRAYSPEFQEQWPEAEIVVADALDRESLQKACDGIAVAYYLIHSLLLGPKAFESTEIQAANNFREAAEKSGIKRIIYLGGLGDTAKSLSPHLKSRIEVAKALKNGNISVTILRAAVIIGAGSASYEILRELVKRLPILLIPHWAENKCQPIAIRDVIKYLVGVLEIPDTSDKTFDIGGTDILSYKEMLQIFAGLLNKKMLFIPFPLSNIGFYAYFANLLTPVPAPITLALMAGLKSEVCCLDDEILDYLPFQRLDYRQAVIRALTREEQDQIYTRWTNAYPPAHELAIKLKELQETPKYTTSYSIRTSKSDAALFQEICHVGGKDGWFSNNWMWRLRGWVDRVLMGVGESRGRRSYQSLKINDVIGFWRIEDLQVNKRLLLRAEMKLPGRAWLEFTIQNHSSERILSVIPYYHTKTIFGKLYWYFFLPFHGIIFNSLIKQIEKRSAFTL